MCLFNRLIPPSVWVMRGGGGRWAYNTPNHASRLEKYLMIERAKKRLPMIDQCKALSNDNALNLKLCPMIIDNALNRRTCGKL